MKLIKLSSDTSGEFENLFNTDIKVKPFSKIGLLSASVPLSNQIITIDTTNDTFEMKTNAASSFSDVVIKHGSYTATSFISELKRALNVALENDNEQHATVQWKTKLSSNKIQLLLRRGDYNVEVAPADLSIDKNLTYDTTAKSYTHSGGDWTAFGETKTLFTNGAGEISLEVVAKETYFAVGLLKESLPPSTTTLSPIDYDYVIYSSGGNYMFQQKGSSPVDTGKATVDNAQITIELTGGKMKFLLINGDEQTLHALDNWTYTSSYHMAFSVNTGTVEDAMIDPDPFFSEVDGALVATPHRDVLYDATTLGVAPSRAIASISFKNKPRTGTYMGFHDSEYVMPNAGLTWDLTADESIEEGVSFTDLLVELPNLPMQSFDGALSKQRPVIAYIPSLEVKNSELVYNAIQPIMIDMNNAHAFNLNRVQVRLLTSSSSAVAIQGASIVVVLSC